MKRFISALVVFTLVLTCAMSAVSAANFATTTTYTTDNEVIVETVVNAGEDFADAMVSYVIYEGNSIDDDSINYIDQQTTNSSGYVKFTVTDAISRLDGNKVVMGTNKGTLTPAVDDVDDVVNEENSGSLLLTVDEEEFEDGLVTVYVTQV
ncbi:MAG: hypothetical protein UH854_05235, partial [Clostridia bacterium]|nr:hypothetical protein [Clostridia bacterium]